MVCVVALPPEQHGDVGGVGSNLCYDGTDLGGLGDPTKVRFIPSLPPNREHNHPHGIRAWG